MIKNGTLFGKNNTNGSLIVIDNFNKEKYKNSNICIFGTSGSGKSYFTKLNILRRFLEGKKQYVIDPEREYEKICKYLGGDIIKIGHNSNKYINILDIRKQDTEKEYLRFKLNRLKSFFKLIFEDIKSEEYGEFEDVLIETYREYGINFDDKSLYLTPDNSELNNYILEKFKGPDKMPILEDIYTKLINTENLKKYGQKLKPFVYGALNCFNKRTNIDIDNKLIVADIFDLGEENYKYGMSLFIDTFWNKIKENRDEEKIIYIDEVWRIIGNSSNPETARFVQLMFKTIRKYNGSIVCITQDINDMFSLEFGIYGKGIINNSSTLCIFNLKEENIEELSRVLNLTENEKIQIRGLKKGEMVLSIEDRKILCKVISNNLEKNIIEGEEDG